jgi:hypothetical protein
MAKTFEFERFDVYGPGRIDPQGDGHWIKAQDAIDREKVNADRIRTLELQLKEALPINTVLDLWEQYPGREFVDQVREFRKT